MRRSANSWGVSWHQHAECNWIEPSLIHGPAGYLTLDQNEHLFSLDLILVDVNVSICTQEASISIVLINIMQSKAMENSHTIHKSMKELYYAFLYRIDLTRYGQLRSHTRSDTNTIHITAWRLAAWLIVYNSNCAGNLPTLICLRNYPSVPFVCMMQCIKWVDINKCTCH